MSRLGDEAEGSRQRGHTQDVRAALPLFGVKQPRAFPAEFDGFQLPREVGGIACPALRQCPLGMSMNSQRLVSSGSALWTHGPARAAPELEVRGCEALIARTGVVCERVDDEPSVERT